MTTALIQGPFPPAKLEGVPTIADPVPAQPKKPGRKLWIIFLIIGGVLLCLFALCLISALKGIGGMTNEKAAIESILNSYMQSMEARDAQAAYDLFAPRAQRQIPLSDFQDLLEGNNYYVFEGYQSISVQTLFFSSSINSNPNVPQGRIAKVSGTVSYDGNFQGTFNGTLEKVNGYWMLDGMYVSVPPDKFP